MNNILVVLGIPLVASKTVAPNTDLHSGGGIFIFSKYRKKLLELFVTISREKKERRKTKTKIWSRFETIFLLSYEKALVCVVQNFLYDKKKLVSTKQQTRFF